MTGQLYRTMVNERGWKSFRAAFCLWLIITVASTIVANALLAGVGWVFGFRWFP